jgi:hypothetical protein
VYHHHHHHLSCYPEGCNNLELFRKESVTLCFLYLLLMCFSAATLDHDIFVSNWFLKKSFRLSVFPRIRSISAWIMRVSEQPIRWIKFTKRTRIHQDSGSENISYTVNNKSPKRPRRHRITRNKYFFIYNIYQELLRARMNRRDKRVTNNLTLSVLCHSCGVAGLPWSTSLGGG